MILCLSARGAGQWQSSGQAEAAASLSRWFMPLFPAEVERGLHLLLLFSCSVLSDSLRPHELQHDRLPCASLSPRVCSNPCPLSRQCHPTISSSVVAFSSRLQSFPASGSFLMSHLFVSGGQSIGASASASNEYSGLISFRMDWLDLLAVQGAPKGRLQHHSSKASILLCSASFMAQLSPAAGGSIIPRWISVP